MSKIRLAEFAAVATLAAGAAGTATQAESAPVKHPTPVERTAHRDVSKLAQAITALTTSQSPSVSYSHSNIGHNQASLRVTVTAAIVGSKLQGQYTLMETGPSDANGSPDPNKVQEVLLEADELTPVITDSNLRLPITDLIYTTKGGYTGGGPDVTHSGPTFLGLYQEGSTVANVVEWAAGAHPTGHQTAMTPHFMNLVFNQGKQFINDASHDYAIGETSLPSAVKPAITFAG